MMMMMMMMMMMIGSNDDVMMTHYWGFSVSCYKLQRERNSKNPNWPKAEQLKGCMEKSPK